MVLALLVTLITVTLSGMKLYAVEEGKGPFAQEYSFSWFHQANGDENKGKEESEENEDEEEYWEEIHEASVNVLLLLIVLHILGVIFTSIQHKESLVKAMMSGKKKE